MGVVKGSLLGLGVTMWALLCNKHAVRNGRYRRDAVRREPEALPFCALAYALIGVISTVLAALPFVSSAIIAIVGA